MSATKTKAGKRTTNGRAPLPAIESGAVLSLTEAAAYLRVSEEAVLRMVRSQGLAGRNIGDEWRFLRSAVDEWLRVPLPTPSKQALAAVIGSWKEDPDLEAMLQEIYQRRGRPMVEEEA